VSSCLRASQGVAYCYPSSVDRQTLDIQVLANVRPTGFIAPLLIASDHAQAPASKAVTAGPRCARGTARSTTFSDGSSPSVRFNS
jgi:hypothetical protein